MPDKILDSLTSPQQLRQLTDVQLVQLAEELRAMIIDVVSRRGGHLASNLGIAELTIALHHVFDFSQDRLVWDVGHQCYPHKILTGRSGQFASLRQGGGMSGFPSPAESPYDLFYTGHAGTAISTAAGLAWADQLQGRKTRSVAVVGDASIVTGLSLEGINNAALLKRQFLIVLNDNSMAIDRTGGAMAHMLDRVRTAQTYSEMKQSAENLLQHLPMGPGITKALHNLKAGIKTSLHGGQVFESLGFEYFGPVDGHNIPELIRILRRLAVLDRPALLHVHTQKGHGCQYAVEDPCRFHSPPAYTLKDGKAVFAEKTRPSWTKVFSQALVEIGRKDERVVAITAAMPDGTGLVPFRKEFPERYVDVGINESHAVAVAAGMAKSGLRPIVAIYSTFMQRAFDQVFQEVSLQRLPVLLCMDRAGLVGSDGAVHHGITDIAFLRPLPDMVLMAPSEGPELQEAMEFALTLPGPAAIRYPRDEVPVDLNGPCPPFGLGRAHVIREPEHWAGALVCYGVVLEQAVCAADILLRENGILLTVVNARFAKPLDDVLISRLIASGKPMLLIEEHAAAGGFGSAVLEMAASRGLNASNVRQMGLGDRYIAHATRQEQLTEAGLDATTIAATIKDMIQKPEARSERPEVSVR